MGTRHVSRAEGVVGWRFWDVAETDDGWRLRSPYWSTTWVPAEDFEAECLVVDRVLRAAPPHEAPDEHCRCGIYGGTYAQLQSFVRANLSRHAEVPVIGRVVLWGVVVPGAGGWRAGRAYPLELLVPRLTRRASELAPALEAYGVPVELLDAGATLEAVYRPRTDGERHLTSL